MRKLANGWRFFEVAVFVVSLAHLVGCSGCGKPQTSTMAVTAASIELSDAEFERLTLPS